MPRIADAFSNASSPFSETFRKFLRHKTLTTVHLTEQGNFVVDIPVPEKVKSQVRLKIKSVNPEEDTEFTHIRCKWRG